MKRQFLKNAIIELLEADGFDGALTVDSPSFFVREIRINADDLKIYLDIRFEASQGNVPIDFQRTYTVDYQTLPNGAKLRFKDLYDFVTDNVLKVIPKTTRINRTMIYLILIIAIAIEVINSGSKINAGINTPANWLVRGLSFTLMVGWYLVVYPFYYDEFLSVIGLSVFGYWLLFDGFLNLYRGLNWFYIGQTKGFDKFWKSHPGLQMLSHWIKWTGFVCSLVLLIQENIL